MLIHSELLFIVPESLLLLNTVELLIDIHLFFLSFLERPVVYLINRLVDSSLSLESIFDALGQVLPVDRFLLDCDVGQRVHLLGSEVDECVVVS